MDRPLTNETYRRRSPGYDRRPPRPRRGRSRSPGDRWVDGGRDRHDYYDRGRDARFRDDRRRPSPGPGADRFFSGQAPPPASKINSMPDPLTLDFQVGYSWFTEWWRAEKAMKEEKERGKDDRRPSERQVKSEQEVKEERDQERTQIQSAYDDYKEALQGKLAKLFVQVHRDEEWFKERYVPQVCDQVKQELSAFRKGALQRWQDSLQAGTFDNFTLEGIYKNDSNGMGGVNEREEGETVAVAEVLSVADLVPSRGGDILDEDLMQPALLIKTLAPSVSRSRIEAFCKENLGEQDGGYRWLSLSEPNPAKRYHRIGWIMLHPATEDPKLERGDGRDEETNDAADTAEDGLPEEEIKLPVSAEQKAVQIINGKIIEDEGKGNFTCHVGVHEPVRDMRKRALWDLFSAPERIVRDLELARRLVNKYDHDLGDQVDNVSAIETKVQDLRNRGLLQAAPTAKASEKSQDARMNGIENADGEAEDGAIEDEDEVDDEDLMANRKALDLLVECLRRVYNFCFFCVFESDSVHELNRKCPSGHLRRPRASLTKSAKLVAKASAQGAPFPDLRQDASNADKGQGQDQIQEGDNGSSHENEGTEAARSQVRPFDKSDQQLQRAFHWVKTYEDKILQILEPENVDLQKLGGRPLDAAVDEEIGKFVKQEDENKFRCKVPECTKLFKGESFWRKHVEKRHEQWFDDLRSNLALVNAFVLDPSHMSVTRTDATGYGGATGRGFNSYNSGARLKPAFATFGTHTVHAPMNGNWPGMMNADGHGPGGGYGPLRRGGRYGGGRGGGPYDRRGGGGGGYGNRSYPNGGMSNPMMMPPGMAPAGPTTMMNGGGRRGGYSGGGGGGGGTRWGDGAGNQAVGPKEAVMGRTLKRYDDLDAVGGPGVSASMELNY